MLACLNYGPIIDMADHTGLSQGPFQRAHGKREPNAGPS